jgi:Uma2 family endonuclease
MSWTIDRYQAAIEGNIIREDDRVELLFGTIIKKMPASEPHGACIDIIREYFTERYFKQYSLRSESAVRLPYDSLPEPDFTVAAYRQDHYANGFPEPAAIYLLIEVAESSLKIDRTIKAKAYAHSAIAEYWIVNLKQRQLELHLQPDPGSQSFRKVLHFTEEETFVSPFAGKVAVSDLLPSVS